MKYLKRKLSWIRTGESGRVKNLAPVHILLIIALLTLTIFLSVLVSVYYTPFILNKDLGGRKEWLPAPRKFLSSHLEKFFRDNYAAIINVLLSSEPSIKSFVPSVRIQLESNGLERMNHEIVLFGLGKREKKPKVKGLYETLNGKAIAASFSLRGTNSWHHQIWKPSLRMRTRKSSLVDGFQIHNYNALKDPSGIRNWLTVELNKNWKLLSNKEHFVRLFINGTYKGLYSRFWELDESLLINTGRLPGLFFRLEPKNKRIFFIKSLNWYIPEAWEVIGANDSAIYDILSPVIVEFQNGLLKGNREGFSPYYLKKINNWIDKDSFARYLAILVHAGENHIDNVHNNAFWLDSASGKLAPVLLDVNGYGMRTGSHVKRPIIKQKGAFVKFWLKHPQNLALFVDYLFSMLNTFGSVESVKKIIQTKWENIRADALADLYSSEMADPRLFFPITELDDNVEKIIRFVELRNPWLLNQLTSDELFLSKEGPDYFEVYVKGLSGFSAKRDSEKIFKKKGFDNKNQNTILLPSMRRDTRQGSFLKHPPLEIVPGLKTIKNINLPDAFGFYSLAGHPEEYEFFHRLTNKKVSLKRINQNLRMARKTVGLNSQVFTKPSLKPIIIGPGEVIFDKSKTFNVGQPVTIKGGTFIKLGPGVSLLIRGPLTVEGTERSPVKIRPLFPKKPFGVLALFGQDTRGSSVNHLNMKGGSTDRFYNLFFTGMFSVHDCPDIKILNSFFGRNYIGDDAVHLMRSRALIKNTIFKDAIRDALDLDLVVGSIIDSIFEQSGNDGLDVSMGRIKVSGSRFFGSKDKCISVGEGSHANILNSLIRQCSVGIAVKDSSTVNLNRTVFAGNGIAYNTYKKKWRWENGGTGNFQGVRFIDSIIVDIKGDKFSTVNFPSLPPQNTMIKGKLHIGYISQKIRQPF